MFNTQLIERALRFQALARQIRFKFADEKGDGPAELDTTDLDLDVKSELRKKFTG
jgi:hypothetical protein